MKPYYLKYDDHYRSLYRQGIKYWSDGPDHCRQNIEDVIALLKRLLPEPAGKTLLEIGCGEGHLALPIAEAGFKYTGVDVSPAAIEKARARTAGRKKTPYFDTADAVTAGAPVFKKQYDVVLDQACFHMLVVDDDCRRYLGNVRGLMNDGSFFLMLSQARKEDAYDGPVTSIEQYQESFQHDLNRPKSWEAWNGKEWTKVELPSFAGRPRSRDSYIREARRAGFEILEIAEKPEGRMLDLVLKKAQP